MIIDEGDMDKYVHIMYIIHKDVSFPTLTSRFWNYFFWTTTTYAGDLQRDWRDDQNSGQERRWQDQLQRIQGQFNEGHGSVDQCGPAYRYSLLEFSYKV